MMRPRSMIAMTSQRKICLLHVVRGQEHGAPLGLDDADQVPEVVAGLRVEAGGRLVEEQDLRIVGERDREQQALRLAAGELAVVAVRHLLERAEADQLVHVAPARIEPPEKL